MDIAFIVALTGAVVGTASMVFGICVDVKARRAERRVDEAYRRRGAVSAEIERTMNLLERAEPSPLPNEHESYPGSCLESGLR